MEEEEKLIAETQTAAEEKSGNAVQAQPNIESKTENNAKVNEAGQAKADDTSKQGGDSGQVSKAFGNDSSDNKIEGEKGKKTNTVATKNQDGSISFANQKELDDFIGSIYAKGAKKGEKQGTVQEVTPDGTETQEPKAGDGSGGVIAEPGTEEEIEPGTETAVASVDFRDSIALALAETDGINPKKARRASMLIDQTKIATNGVLDQAKLQQEINLLISEWPDLKNTANEGVQSGFKFGGDSNSSDSSNATSTIASIFGNS